MMRRALLLLVFGLTVSVFSFAHDEWGEIYRDRQDIRGDRTDLRQDYAKLRRDRWNRNWQAVHRDRADIARDRADLRRDYVDLRQDRRDYYNDHNGRWQNQGRWRHNRGHGWRNNWR